MMFAKTASVLWYAERNGFGIMDLMARLIMLVYYQSSANDAIAAQFKKTPEVREIGWMNQVIVPPTTFLRFLSKVANSVAPFARAYIVL